MAVTCAHCAAPNPDGNLYCQSCGTRLPVAVPVGAPPAGPPPPPGAPPAALTGPPPGLAPPVAGPSGYQSPYYVPTGPVPPVHRTPWTLIIAGVVALVLLMAGFGTAFAVIANRGANTSGTSIGNDIPSPSPAGTPTPSASASPTPLGTTTASNDGLSVKVPQGWSVASKDTESIVLTDPNGEGSVTFASGPSSPTQSAQDNKNTIDAYFKSKYPDARACPGTSTTSKVVNGARGLSWTVCFTLTEGARSAPAAASLFGGANPSGSVYYVVMVFSRADTLQSYLTTSAPVLQSVVWKLS